MDLPTLLLDLLETGLGIVLSSMLLLTARRYADRRFAIVAAGMLALASAGGLGVVGQLASLPSFSAREEAPFSGSLQLGLVVVAALLVAELLLYAALITSRAPSHAGRE